MMERSEEETEVVHLVIAPDLSKWEQNVQAAGEAEERLSELAQEAWTRAARFVIDWWKAIPDSIREAAAIEAGLRYWTDQQGRARRTPGRKPILNNGKKP